MSPSTDPDQSSTPDLYHLKYGTRSLIEEIRSSLTNSAVDIIVKYAQKLEIKLDPNQPIESARTWINENGIDALIYALNALDWILPEKEKTVLRQSRERLDELLKTFPNENTLETRNEYRAEIEARQIELAEALSIINNHNAPLSIEIVSQITIGGGTAGVASLIAHGLQYYVPHLTVSLTFVGENSSVKDFELISSERGNVYMRSVSISELQTTTPSHGADLVIGYQLTDKVRGCIKSSFDCHFKILPNEQTQDPVSNLNCLTMNLSSAFGGLPLNPDLKEKCEASNGLTMEMIEIGRIDWLARNLSDEAQENLYRQHTESGLNPSKGTWAFGYFQDAESLLSEISGLCELLRDDDSALDALGRNVCLHLIPGRHVYSMFSIQDLTDLGCWVVTDTDIHYPIIEEEVPLTVIVHSNVPHKELLELQYRLCIVPQRDETDSFWLRPPAIVTGNASWLEAVSAGIPWLHDGYDSGQRGIYNVLESILRRQSYTTTSRPSSKENKIERDKHLAGISDPSQTWGSIEKFMNSSTLLSEQMYTFNLVEDILRALASKILKSNNTK